MAQNGQIVTPAAGTRVAAPRPDAPPVEPLFPQLRPRKNVPRERVAANQRARLHGAMIEAVARHGYTATTVQELTRLAGVNKKTLYKHFEDKLDCFLATYDLVVREAVQRISAAYRSAEPDGRDSGGGRDRDWQAGLCRAFDAFARELALRPKRARLALVEVLAVGRPALARIERGEAVFVAMIGGSLAQAPDGPDLPPVLLKGIVGGIWYVARSHMSDGARPRHSLDTGRQLLEWMLAYRSPAIGALAEVRTPPPSAAAGDTHRRLAAADGLPVRTRMLHAAAHVAAEGGYGTLTTGQIAELAGVDVDAVNAEFKDVGECFLAALELLSARALAAALRASAGSTDWPSAVCRSVRALLGGIAEDPVFARVAFVELFAAGPAGATRRMELMRGFAAVLARRAPADRRPAPLVAEAIAGAVWTLAHREVVHGRARTLPALAPYACYLTLAPILGAEAAVAAVLEGCVPASTTR